MSLELSSQAVEEPKPYQAPQIVLEIELESQAGSPAGLPDFEDEFDTP
ncbi:MAG: hypothetical protein N3D16_00150 [Anaerolineales bacterium]|nr:hypothetical protein [Anaerolineales bacterium]